MSEVISTINPFDDPAGAFQGKEKGYLPFGLDAKGGLLTGSGGAKPGKRGQARGGGVDPDAANFALNWDQSGLQNLNNFAGGTASDAIATRGIGGNIRDQAGGAALRSMAPIDQAGAQAGLGVAGMRGAAEANLAGGLETASGIQTGSAAQNVRQQGTNDALSAALALAGSGGGLGGSAAAMSQAMNTAPAEIARAANDAAQIQQASDEANAARRLQGLGMAADVTSQARQGDLAGAGLSRQLGLDISEQDLARLSLNDQLRLGLGNLGLGYEQTGIEGQLGAGQLGAEIQNIGLQGSMADLEGRIAYERALNELYGIDSAQQLGMRQLDIEKGKNAMGSIGGIGTAVAGLAMLSDARAKKNVRLTSLRDRFAAIGEQAP